jgi:hypothetical protein
MLLQETYVMGISINAGRDVQTGDVFEGTKVEVKDLEDSQLDMGDVAGRAIQHIASDSALSKTEAEAATDAVETLAEKPDDHLLIEASVDVLRRISPYALKILVERLPWLAKML